MRYVIKETNEIMTLRRYWNGMDIYAMSDTDKGAIAGWYKITSITGEDFDDATHTQGDVIITYNDDAYTATVEYPLIAKPEAIAKTNLKARITAERWERMNKPITFMEHKIATDDVAQTRLTSIVMAYSAGLITSNIDYKTMDGWIILNEKQVRELAALVASHVQACFAWEREQMELVDASAEYPT